MVLPNWIKTLKQGSTNVWNVSTALRGTFHVATAKAGDTGEIQFEDGTVLSSIGAPSSNKNTYLNRSGITPVNSNWK